MATPRLFVLLLTLTTLTSPALAQNIITVTNANDLQNGNVSSIAALQLNDGNDGVSLREAVAAANNTPNVDAATPDQIHFDIDGEGPHVITKLAFWFIEAPVVIDGYTQPGASPATATQPADIRIELTTSQLGHQYGLAAV